MNTSAAYGARLTINLGALTRNYHALRDMAAPSTLGAAVKGNAYGCGVDVVVPALHAVGCRDFFVAQPVEALDVRAALDGAPARVFVLNGFNPDAASLYGEHDLIAVLGCPSEVAAWNAASHKPAYALHVDTGMNRLGLRFDEIEDLDTASDPVLLMTHMACADEPSHPLNDAQFERFDAVRALFPDVPASLANSAATLNGWAKDYALARPGIALYGGAAVETIANPMEPVVTVEARVVQTRDVRHGETVGYGASWHAARDSQVAILSAGYADGYLRCASVPTGRTGPFAAIAGERVPLAGRVSMDLIAVDVTDLDMRPAPGTWAELIGPNVPLDEVAGWAETIPYEVLTRLGPRFERRIIPAHGA